MSKRILQGVVVRNSGDKTIVVRVERRVRHPLYKKIIRRSKKYHAHDENEEYKTRDLVEIKSCRPKSKTKRWVVSRLLERPPEV